MSTPSHSPFTTPARDPHWRRSAVDQTSWHGSGSEGNHTVSPTGSTSTISDLASSTGTTHRFTDSARIAALRHVSTVTPQGTPPRRKAVIRAEPTMLTCFDPADKELYELWAPKQ